MYKLHTEKILLCIPRGGLNDTLCQIEKCRRYAEAYDRRLYVDTRKSGLLGNADLFFRMAKTGKRPAVMRMDETAIDSLNTMVVHPAVVQGRVGQYRSVYSRTHRNICEESSGIRLTFDFATRHDTPVLLHEQCGGGTLSQDLLPHLTLSEELRAEVLHKLAMLPDTYVACHIRNTDYQTDYLHFFESIEKRVASRRLLVCSDDAQVIAEAREFFARSVVLTCGDIPDLSGRPLHRPENYQTDGERFRATAKALADLFALASASELHTTVLRHCSMSGFSSLAEYLHTNKHLIASLLQLQTKPSAR